MPRHEMPQPEVYISREAQKSPVVTLRGKERVQRFYDALRDAGVEPDIYRDPFTSAGIMFAVSEGDKMTTLRIAQDF